MSKGYGGAGFGQRAGWASKSTTGAHPEGQNEAKIFPLGTRQGAGGDNRNYMNQTSDNFEKKLGGAQ